MTTTALFSHPAAVRLTAAEDPARAGFISHCGDPLGETRAASEATALCDRSYQRIIELTGSERLVWLNNLISQQVLDLPAGATTEALNLDAQGRVLEHLTITATPDALLLDVDAAQAEGLTTYLSRMVFWSEVTVTPRPDYGLLSLLGPTAAATLAAVTVPDSVHVREAVFPAGSRDLLGPREDLAAVADQLLAAGATAAGEYAVTALRVAAVRPRIGIDTTPATIPHEIHALLPTAVHLHKGCYRGQETVSRVDNLGRPPYRLVLLHLDGSAGHRPVAGDAVTANGRTVGTLTTVTDHHELGLCALARVKSAVTPGIELAVADCAALIDAGTYPADLPQAGREAIAKLRQR